MRKTRPRTGLAPEGNHPALCSWDINAAGRIRTLSPEEPLF